MSSRSNTSLTGSRDSFLFFLFGRELRGKNGMAPHSPTLSEESEVVSRNEALLMCERVTCVSTRLSTTTLLLSQLSYLFLSFIHIQHFSPFHSLFSHSLLPTLTHCLSSMRLRNCSEERGRQSDAGSMWRDEEAVKRRVSHTHSRHTERLQEKQENQLANRFLPSNISLPVSQFPLTHLSYSLCVTVTASQQPKSIEYVWSPKISVPHQKSMSLVEATITFLFCPDGSLHLPCLKRPNTHSHPDWKIMKTNLSFTDGEPYALRHRIPYHTLRVMICICVSLILHSKWNSMSTVSQNRLKESKDFWPTTQKKG